MCVCSNPICMGSPDFGHGQTRELLQKWKAQYSWPPSKDRLFCKEEKYIVLVWKAADLSLIVKGGQRYLSSL
jgi:hypothetical protein